MRDAVHFAHCNIGRYRDACKFGHPDCPALLLGPPAPPLGEAEKVLRAIYAEGMNNHATRCAPWWNDVVRAQGKS